MKKYFIGLQTINITLNDDWDSILLSGSFIIVCLHQTKKPNNIYSIFSQHSFLKVWTINLTLLVFSVQSVPKYSNSFHSMWNSFLALQLILELDHVFLEYLFSQLYLPSWTIKLAVLCLLMHPLYSHTSRNCVP